ncbi:MAG: hypothetical protein IPM06_19035 [Rhizobiales bacterium]|nr:hypothetical protein [Hyphomicrobiales bacterium]
MPKVVMFSHSSNENLTRDWINTAALEAPVARHPCHRIHNAAAVIVQQGHPHRRRRLHGQLQRRRRRRPGAAKPRHRGKAGRMITEQAADFATTAAPVRAATKPRRPSGYVPPYRNPPRLAKDDS